MKQGMNIPHPTRNQDYDKELKWRLIFSNFCGIFDYASKLLPRPFHECFIQSLWKRYSLGGGGGVMGRTASFLNLRNSFDCIK